MLNIIGNHLESKELEAFMKYVYTSFRGDRAGKICVPHANHVLLSESSKSNCATLFSDSV